MSRAPTIKPGSSSEVDAFLKKVAGMPQIRSEAAGRLVFALDATMSREPTWDRAMALQSEMFAATAALGGLEIQLVYFRGFGEFAASPWAPCGGDLLQAMTGVECRGGRTQITKVLDHALRESAHSKVNALIYIGDAVEEPLDRLADLAGQLGLKGVPVFLFHEGRDLEVERIFREIAHLSRGAYCRFDSHSAQMLKELLTAVAVYAAGGRKALRDYSKTRSNAVKLLARQIG